MKQVQFLIALWLGTVVAATSAHGQASQQKLSFSIFGQYETNQTAPIDSHTETNQTTLIKSALISTPSIVKAIAIDLAGSQWTNWSGASLVRKIALDPAPGAEGIFLVKGATETNVSKFFGSSFTSNFTSGVAGSFLSITNYNNRTNLNGLTNCVESGIFSTNQSGAVTKISTNINSLGSSRLFYVALDTTSLQFNLLGFGSAATTELIGRIGATHYTNLVQTLEVAGIGTFNWNVAAEPQNASVIISGPAHGSFGTAPPTFSTNSFER